MIVSIVADRFDRSDRKVRLVDRYFYLRLFLGKQTK